MKNIVKAIYDDDLLQFLQSIGILADLQEGRINCIFCHEKVTIATFCAALPDNDAINVICNNPKCLVRLNDKKMEG